MVGQNIGKYRVLDRIGRGGMGTVYRALDETLHREVAIKVLNAELNDPEVARRFRAEAVTVARLNHPGIATIYELFQNDGQWLMVMEYVRGETLERMVDRLGPQSPQRAADLLMQALAALAHAHSQGVVHRDLKPANLMSTEAGAVKIMDFGIARVSGAEHLTSAGFMMGTPAYMAPEQVLGQEIDARTDLYALGVVFYYLLSGKLPFKGETPIAMAQSRINDQPTPLRNVREGLPPWLEPVIERALSKQSEGRFQTADLFREALRRGLAGLPMDATASTPTELIQTTPPNAMPIMRPAAASTSSSTPPSIAVDAATPNPGAAGATMPLGSTAPTILSPSSSPAKPAPAPGPAEAPAKPAAAKSAETPSAPAAKGADAKIVSKEVPAKPAATPPAPPKSPADAKSAASSPAPADRKPAAAAAPKTAAPAKSNTGMLVGIAAVVLLALGGGYWWMRHNAAVANDTPPAADQAAATTPAPTAPAPAPTPDTNAASATPPQTPPPPDASNPATATPGASATTPATTAANASTPGRGTAPPASGTAANTTTAPGTRGATPPTGRGAAPAPTTPVASVPGDELVQFQDAKLLLITGRKADDEDVTIQLGGGEVIVAPRKGGAPIASEPYTKLVRATFVHARDPRWESALPHPADSPLDLPGVFHPARNWLVLQSRTDFVILRLDDSNVNKVLDTIQSRAGLTISRPGAGGE